LALGKAFFAERPKKNARQSLRRSAKKWIPVVDTDVQPDNGRHGQVMPQDELAGEYHRWHGHDGLAGRQHPDRTLLLPDLRLDVHHVLAANMSRVDQGHAGDAQVTAILRRYVQHSALRLRFHLHFCLKSDELVVVWPCGLACRNIWSNVPRIELLPA
jgi:hypothetical protein